VVAHKKNKWYSKDASHLLRDGDHGSREWILFADEADAREHGFHFRRSAGAGRPPQRAGLKHPS